MYGSCCCARDISVVAVNAFVAVVGFACLFMVVRTYVRLMLSTN